MIQVLLHLLGDYFLQNDVMAVNKGKFTAFGWWMCFLHCMLYSIPFLFYYNLNWYIFVWVFATHFLIDKFGLAEYRTRFANWDWNKDHLLGMKPERPVWLVVWLHIIRDNSLHVACNYFIIQHFIK